MIFSICIKTSHVNSFADMCRNIGMYDICVCDFACIFKCTHIRRDYVCMYVCICMYSTYILSSLYITCPFMYLVQLFFMWEVLVTIRRMGNVYCRYVSGLK